MPTPCAIASAGELQADLLAVDLDGPGVRRLDAVQDLHQRRLAGAVLADDGVDGAAVHVDVDVVVGDDTGESLADATQSDRDRQRRRCRRPERMAGLDTGDAGY